MFPQNSCAGFEEHPQDKTRQSTPCLSFPFFAEIMERLLHGLSQTLSEPSWIEGEKLFVESVNQILVICHT